MQKSQIRDVKAFEFIARAINGGFPVIDLAMTREGQWIIIECNDAMESGYAGVPPIALWQNILDLLA